MFSKSCCRGVLNNICTIRFFPSPSPFSDFVFTLLSANTFALILAPSALSAGGHSQVPPSCFSTPACFSNRPHVGEIEPLRASAEVWLKAEGCLLPLRRDQSISGDLFKLMFRSLSDNECVCLVSAGGRIDQLDNVTEEVQSLKTRVELLEKVSEKRASKFRPDVPDVHSFPPPSRSYSWCWPRSPASSRCRWTTASRRRPPYCPTPSSSWIASTPSASRSAFWRSVWAHVSGNTLLTPSALRR